MTARGNDRSIMPTARLVYRWLLPLGALLLAIVAVVSAYVVSGAKSPGGPVPAIVPAQSHTPLILEGAFSTEPGPDGAEWQWIGDQASTSIGRTTGKWIAFRALSLRVARTLTLTDTAGKRVSVQIRTKPDSYITGPFAPGRILLRAAPPSIVASRHDKRRVSVFLSQPRLVITPLVASTGAGFWPAERSDGTVFNWLRDVGVINVDAPPHANTLVWLTFVARSLGEPRELVTTSGATRYEVGVPTTAQTEKIGPFKLVNGHSRVSLRAIPGPMHYGSDPRLLSVEVALLDAHTSPSES